MNTKKILSVALACSMLLAMSAQAFASVVPGANTTVPGAATVKIPTVKISVPAKLDFTMDPLNVGQKGQVFPTGVTDDAALIENLSEVPVDLIVVSAKGTAATTPGEAALATVPPTAATADKEAYLFVRAIAADAKDIATTKTGLARIKDDAARKFTAATETKAGDVLLLADVSAAKPSLLYSFAAGKESATTPGDFVATPEGRALISIGGIVTPKPTDDWTDKDTVAAEVILKVLPKAVVA